ncbi:c-type cytochrome [Rhodovulum euryhalinum]|uniref:Cytochrome c n=1 Tax=Rhodovulum euryhalinum TaxID=35805 RepID=A0A4R2KMJ0_9RHOB|nr:cytochrome c family protein [Rhodovulum euryhalinum]TCO71956.1 cytochrome c [Rhodovulum euryhalinum]
MSAILGFIKFAAALCLALAIFFVVNLASGGLFTNRDLEEPAYVILRDEEEAPAAPAEEQSFEELLAAADPAAGERVFKECRACHRVEEGVHMVGPSLYNVVGRAVASVSEFKYSDAMTGLDGEWTPERIDAFITNPRDYAPGTAMTFAGLDKAADRAAVIAYLQSLGM